MTRAVFATPARAIPLFTLAGRVFGPSALDNAVYEYRTARDAIPGYKRSLTAAYAKLGRANRMAPENRKQGRSDAFRRINAIRAAEREAKEALHCAEIVLYRVGRLAADVDALDRAPVAVPAFGGISIADDPDMAGARWGRA